MSATTVYARGYKYGKANLDNIIYDWMGIGEFASEDAEQEYYDKFYDKLVEKVNDALPDDMVWFPELSEIWCDVGVDHDDLGELNEYFTEILDKAWDEADAEVEAEMDAEGRAVYGMTIKEKAKEIVLDYEAKRKRGLRHPLGYYIGVTFWIEISELPEKANHFNVKLIDEPEEGPDVIVDDRIETRETIIDAVEQYLHEAL